MHTFSGAEHLPVMVFDNKVNLKRCNHNRSEWQKKPFKELKKSIGSSTCVCVWGGGVNYIIKVIKGERWRGVGPRPNPVKAFDPSLVS